MASDSVDTLVFSSLTCILCSSYCDTVCQTQHPCLNTAVPVLAVDPSGSETTPLHRKVLSRRFVHQVLDIRLTSVLNSKPPLFSKLHCDVLSICSVALKPCNLVFVPENAQLPGQEFCRTTPAVPLVCSS